MKRLFTLSISIISLFIFTPTQAQLVVTDSVDVNVLVQSLVGSGVTVSNAMIDCPYDAYGTFDGVNSNVGMDNGIILTSGLAVDAIGPNDTGSNNNATADTAYTDWMGDALLDSIVDPFTTNNACILEFDITVGCADTVCFNYSFASEEYLEFVNSNFNDAFGLFVSGMNPAGGTYNQENIAIIPGTNTPVTIDNVNDATNSQFYINNGDGSSAPQNTDSTVVQYDGLTVVLPACFAVVPYETYTLRISIADTGDEAWDSGVFIQGQSLSSNTVAVSSNATVQGFDNAVAGCVDGEFEFLLSPSASDLTIYLDYQGSAVSGVDYTAGPDSLVVPAGYTSASLFIDALDAGVVDGNDTLVLIVDAGACGISDTAILVIEDAPAIAVSGDGLICNGDSIQLSASGALSYLWTPAIGLSASTISNPMASPDVSTTYTVTMEYGDCTYTESVLVEVCPPCPTDIEIGTSAPEGCNGEILDIIYTLDDLNTPATVTWSGPFPIDEVNGTTVLENTSCAPFEAEFIVTAVCDQDPNVVLSDTVLIIVYPSDISSFVTSSESECGVSLSVDPNCTDWITVDAAPVINEGDEGSADLTAYYGPSDCAADVTYTLNYDCPLCAISQFDITKLPCDGSSYMMQVDIAAVDNSSDFVLRQDGVDIGVYNYADSPFILGPFPGNGVDYTFSAEDTGDANCTASSLVVGQFCDCNSVPGTIMVNSMNICPDDLSIVDADDFLLEPGQSVYYLYHNQPTVDSLDLPDLNSEVYTTGSFLTNDGSTIPCGQTVYVTAIGANEDLAMPGFPDYNDYCLTFSNTIPVNFLCPISITVDETCNTEFGEFTYSFMVSGGLPQFVSSEEYNVTGDYFTGTVALSGSVVVGPIPDLTSYTITAEDANGCSSSITQTVECEKVPIELISFTGSAVEEGNVLDWATASEIENDYFIVLASTDGTSFTAIAQIDGAGNSSSELKYSYLDREASSGTTYYKLKQTDFDGSTSESQVISVSRAESLAVISDIYPMPADEYIGFIFTANEDSDITLNISDLSGKVLSQEIISVSEGRNYIQMDIESIASGIYFISLDSEDAQTAQKFIKE